MVSALTQVIGNQSSSHDNTQHQPVVYNQQNPNQSAPSTQDQGIFTSIYIVDILSYLCDDMCMENEHKFLKIEKSISSYNAFFFVVYIYI